MSARQNRPKLLVVEDDPGLRKQLKWSFEAFEVVTAEDREGAVAAVRRHEPAVVTLDLGLPPDPGGVSEGMKAIGEILRIAPHTKIIVITGNDARDAAVRAVAEGAYDFYQKPVEVETLRLTVERALRLHELELENVRLQRQARPALEGIVAASPQMAKVCRLIEKVAPTSATVLLLGESGTGKEILARALHELSGREGRMVAINCAAIPETLLESELFGYEKGAFTGATRSTPGKIECADGGTLFLDEVGDLPLALQAKLLRFLQERTVERLGSRREIPVDVRVVCATNQPLQDLIAEGRFREDLYYRINEIEVRIPPLRERAGDAVLLARAFIERHGREAGRRVTGLTPEAAAAIDAWHWPGNVRELENRIRRAVILAEHTRLTPEDLELPVPDEESAPLNLRRIREEAERKAVLHALARAEGRVQRAAELLGITRPTLYALMARLGIQPPRGGNGEPQEAAEAADAAGRE
ncbi:MAG TPA: PEP-CTERM-box response regulator transcription factor [Chromatiales bacterium]|nr:PEP-CTERM-box response regulator transcription factor [Chromatiales bacterium]